MSYQMITIVGNIGRDAELTYTQQGIAVSKFTVAVNKVSGRGEARQEKTIWFKVTLWRERAENLSNYIKKGQKILITGEVDVSAYLDKNGQPQASLELTGNTVEFLTPRTEGQGGGESAEYAPAPTAPANSRPSRGRGNNTPPVDDTDDIPF